ncbi:MAG: hypothetical protein JJ878_17435, partial [Alphaproteobacteria bacterium]|nr:hypothetical protein [Alphaproteobacteria bacterium]
MAVDGQIPKLGFENGADDQFDFISEQNPAAAGAITIPQPAPGESVSITVPPGQALRVEFDVESTQVNGDGSQITLQLTDGSTVVLQSPEPGAFTADPPLLLTPEGAFDQALALYGYDGFGSQTPTTDADSDPNSVFQFGSDSDAQLTGNAITIEKPGPGDSLVYEIGPGQPLQLTFDLDDVEDILQTDDDIILAFADGAQITFSAMVDAAFSDAPPILLMPDGGLMSAEELLDLGSDINALADALQGIDSAAGNANIGPVTSYGSGSGENYSGLSLGQILNPT